MAFDPLSAAFELGKTAIELMWPDPTKRAQELRLLEELRQSGDLAKLSAHVQLMVGQIEVNKVEAQHSSLFIAGWRPWTGWVCGSALAYNFIVYPLLLWAWVVVGTDVPPPPPVDDSALYPVLLGMLGIGAMRSHDKRYSVDSKDVK